MKLRRLSIDGLRGWPVERDLVLGGKSMSILAENGFGKTTIADACELWSTGDLEAYHRSGVLLDAAISVKADRAIVSVQPEGHPVYTRTLQGRTATSIEVHGPQGSNAVPEPIPLLRHRTMAAFMDRTAGDKKKALLELLGLERLNDIRSALSTAERRSKGRTKDAAERSQAAQEALTHALVGRDLATRCAELSAIAGLDSPVTSASELVSATLPPLPSPSPNSPEVLLQRLDDAVRNFNEDAVAAWNQTLGQKQEAQQHGLHVLLKAGQDLLESWDRDTCPLCLTDQSRSDLAESVTERARDLAESTKALDDQRIALREHGTALRGASHALAALAGMTREGTGVTSEEATAASEGLDAAAAALDDAIARSRPCADVSAPDIRGMSKILRGDLVDSPSGPDPVAALAELASLQGLLRTQTARERDYEVEETVASGMRRLVAIADEEISTTIQSHLDAMSDLIARFHGRLCSSPYYSNVRLVYTDSHSGGVEFSFEFQGGTISPPQRIMSESQLNSLGLALFLARHSYSSAGWKTMVLDDVVNSFDANHRSGLARLLREELADWQVIMVTHDRIFHILLQKDVPGWRFAEITQWDPVGGPVLADGTLLQRLDDALNAGVSASVLAGTARTALESALEAPVSKLKLRVRYKANAAYTAQDYLDALVPALQAEGASAEGLLAAVRDISTRSYLANLEAHHRPDTPPLSTDDLRQLVEDLSELRSQLKCGECGEKIWFSERTDRRGHHQCRCSALAV